MHERTFLSPLKMIKWWGVLVLMVLSFDFKKFQNAPSLLRQLFELNKQFPSFRDQRVSTHGCNAIDKNKRVKKKKKKIINSKKSKHTI